MSGHSFPTDRWLAEGVQALQAGDQQAARAALLRLVAVEPGNAEAWWRLSEAVDGEADRRRCLAKALAADPEHTAAQRQLAQLESGSPEPVRRIRPAVSPAAAVLYPERQEQLLSWKDAAQTAVAPPIRYQSESGYDDVWSGEADLCAYCAGEITPDDGRCPHCRRSLTGWQYRYPHPSANLYIYIALMLGVTQLFAYYVAASFAGQPLAVQVGHTALVAALFLLPIGVYKRWFWAYVGAQIVLVLVGVAVAADGLSEPLAALFDGRPLTPGYEGNLIVDALAGVLQPAILASSAVVILFGLLAVMPDLDRVSVRHIARLDRSVSGAHSFYETGRAFAAREMWATAVLHWQRAAANAPRQVTYLRALGGAYARLGFYERSLDVLQSARQQATNADVQTELDRTIDEVRRLQRPADERVKDVETVAETAVPNTHETHG